MRRKRGDDITGGSRGFKTINPHDGKFLITLCDKNEGNSPLLWWSRLDRPPLPRCHLQCGAGCIYCAQKEVLRLFRIGPEEIYRENIIYHNRMSSQHRGRWLTMEKF